MKKTSMKEGIAKKERLDRAKKERLDRANFLKVLITIMCDVTVGFQFVPTDSLGDQADLKHV
jgi:hypothetical protein